MRVEKDFSQHADLPNRITGFGCAAVCLGLLAAKGGDHTFVVALVFLALVCICDGLWLKVPNALTVTMFFLALGRGVYIDGPAGVIDPLTGFIVGFILYLLPYRFGWFGGGDLKAAAALGAFIGPLAVLQTALFAALAGGALALIRLMVVGARTGKLGAQFQTLGTSVTSRSFEYLGTMPGMQSRFAYGPALALGYAALVVWGGIL
jgi:Flp pilus assembly protein protease CpaA